MFSDSYEPSAALAYLIVLGDLFKGVAWPVAVAGLGLVFKNDIASLLTRIREFSRDGVRLHIPDQTDPNVERLQNKDVLTQEISPLNDPVAARIEEENRKHLDKLPAAGREAILIRALTVQQLSKSFAIVYANIFGSQIRLLKLLNQSPMSNEEIEAYFAGVQRDFALYQGWTVSKFLQFLSVWELVVTEGGQLRITQTGKNFLHFLTENGLQEDRVF